MIVTVGALKGGVGKTTTAVYLALALARLDGRVLLVDADPDQSSSYRWADAAGQEWPADVDVRHEPSRDLERRLRPLVSRYEHVVVDVGPKNAGLLRQALTVSDRLIVPAAPRPLDLTELVPTFNVAADVDEHHPILAAVLLVMTRRTRSLAETREGLAGLDLPVMDAQVPLRESYALAYGTVPRDLGAYIDVLDEIRKDGDTA